MNKHFLMVGARIAVCALMAGSWCGPLSGADAGEVGFTKHRLGQFRSEAVCVADFNGDGKKDVLSGAFVYLAPDWKAVRIRTLDGAVDDQGKGYHDDFANLPLDVDGDGKPDVVTCGWFSQSVKWYRNTLGQDGEWPLEQEEKAGNYEAAQLCDIDGDGMAHEVLPATPVTEWFSVGKLASGKRGLIKHVVSSKPLSYGIGVGDVNRDGRPDILRPEAWFEGPADPRTGAWVEHDWAGIGLGAKDGKAEHTPEILVHDVNGDGLNDVVTSSAHQHGIFWYEQGRREGKTSWTQHVIDDTWSQAHSLALADLDGDRVPELITGKRFMAHNGSDPDEFGPLGVYYYRLPRGASSDWSRHAISFNEGIGSAVNLCAEDLDADGDIDVVVTGKWGGPVWFENQRK